MPIRDDSLFGDEHVRAYRETDGERGYLWRNGTEILLLTTRGRKSKEKRTTPLIHRVDDGRLIIVASRGGDDVHPAWFLNLEDNGEAEVQVLDATFPVVHSVAQGEERERLWKLMTEVWPDYDAYQRNTEREIPVVILERSN